MPEEPLYNAQGRVTETRIEAEKLEEEFLRSFRVTAEFRVRADAARIVAEKLEEEFLRSFRATAEFRVRADAAQITHQKALKFQDQLVSRTRKHNEGDEEDEHRCNGRSQNILNVLAYVDSRGTATAKEIMNEVGVKNYSYFTYLVNQEHLEWVPGVSHPKKLRLTENGKALHIQANL